MKKCKLRWMGISLLQARSVGKENLANNHHRPRHRSVRLLFEERSSLPLFGRRDRSLLLYCTGLVVSVMHVELTLLVTSLRFGGDGTDQCEYAISLFTFVVGRQLLAANKGGTDMVVQTWTVTRTTCAYVEGCTVYKKGLEKTRK
jgi:hypothetical protein